MEKASPRSSPSNLVAASARLESKVEMVYSLLNMLGKQEPVDASDKLLTMSQSPENCITMRQSGCLPLLIQFIHGDLVSGLEPNERARKICYQALRNVVQCGGSPDQEKRSRREGMVLNHLEDIRHYADTLRDELNSGKVLNDSMERHPYTAMATLMKLSFDEEHRTTMATLGGLQAVAELIQIDEAVHGCQVSSEFCVTLRRYALMTLTNLTFGDSGNKALLCSSRKFMKSLVNQLSADCSDLVQVSASLLRNLSWQAGPASKAVLREAGAVTALSLAVLSITKESALRTSLSALWNLSAHSSPNKAEICSVDGFLPKLLSFLTYESPSNTLTVAENAGGILKNVSSHIASRQDLRQVLRDAGCFQILLSHLQSPSLALVSNACGALWNLSARCPTDQQLLIELGAIPMLRSLLHSKHQAISVGSSAALKNLLGAQSTSLSTALASAASVGGGLPPSGRLMARKHRALMSELAQTAEVCENLDSNHPVTSPTSEDNSEHSSDVSNDLSHRGGQRIGGSTASLPQRNLPPSNHPLGPAHSMLRSESRESITSTRSEGYRWNGQPNFRPDLLRFQALNLSNSAEGFGESSALSQCPSTGGPPSIASPSSSDFASKVSLLTQYFSSRLSLHPSPFAPRYDSPTPPPFTPHAPPGGAPSLGEEQEQPIDYSLKKKQSKEIPVVVPSRASSSASSTPAPAAGDDPPPVNYSLVYAEEEDDSRRRTRPHAPPHGANGPPNETALCQDDQLRVYCMEGTPACRTPAAPISPAAISRAESPSSQEKKEAMGHCRKLPEETPLMFSRSSSLDSLSSLDRGSPLQEEKDSDFSRRTSGAISPSDLPDSPSQTMPPSPKVDKKTGTPPLPRTGPLVSRLPQPKTPSPQAKATLKAQAPAPCAPPQQTEEPESVFVEAPLSYAVEGTPFPQSRCSSLSSLTFNATDDSNRTQALAADPPVVTKEEEGQLLAKTNESPAAPEEKEEDGKQDDDSDDEALLSACIRSARPTAPIKTPTTSSASVVPLPSLPPTTFNDSRTSTSDTLQTYQVEDTPVHFLSNENLSVLTVPDEHDGAQTKQVPSEPPVASGVRQDEGGETSSTDESDMLAQVIRNARPKPRASRPPRGSNLPSRTSVPIAKVSPSQHKDSPAPSGVRSRLARRIPREEQDKRRLSGRSNSAHALSREGSNPPPHPTPGGQGPRRKRFPSESSPVAHASQAIAPQQEGEKEDLWSAGIVYTEVPCAPPRFASLAAYRALAAQRMRRQRREEQQQYGHLLQQAPPSRMPRPQFQHEERKVFKVEDTPVELSGPASPLSSLSVSSDSGPDEASTSLLRDAISSGKPSTRKDNNNMSAPRQRPTTLQAGGCTDNNNSERAEVNATSMTNSSNWLMKEADPPHGVMLSSLSDFIPPPTEPPPPQMETSSTWLEDIGPPSLLEDMKSSVSDSKKREESSLSSLLENVPPPPELDLMAGSLVSVESLAMDASTELSPPGAAGEEDDNTINSNPNLSDSEDACPSLATDSVYECFDGPTPLQEQPPTPFPLAHSGLEVEGASPKLPFSPDPEKQSPAPQAPQEAPFRVKVVGAVPKVPCNPASPSFIPAPKTQSPSTQAPREPPLRVEVEGAVPKAKEEETRLTPRARRQQEKERFQTYTVIGKDEDPSSPQAPPPEAEGGERNYSTFKKKKREVLPPDDSSEVDVRFLTYRRPSKEEGPPPGPTVDEEDKYKTYKVPKRAPQASPPATATAARVVKPPEEDVRVVRGKKRGGGPPLLHPKPRTASAGPPGASPPLVPPKPPGIRVRETKTTLLRKHSPCPVNRSASNSSIDSGSSNDTAHGPGGRGRLRPPSRVPTAKVTPNRRQPPGAHGNVRPTQL